MSTVDACPSCGSPLVQPMRWEQRADGDVLIELRCPECLVVSQIVRSGSEMAAMDKRQTAEREAMVEAYEAAVAENMSLLADNLGEALRRDLVGPDDFAPRTPHRRTRPDEPDAPAADERAA